jgi:hypothetical protein
MSAQGQVLALLMLAERANSRPLSEGHSPSSKCARGRARIITAVRCAARLHEQDMDLFTCDGPVLYVFRHHIKIAGLQRDRPVT